MKINTSLAILQQSEYSWDYFADWFLAHQKNLPTIAPQKWTNKLKIIKFLTIYLFFLPLQLRLKVALDVFNIFEFPIKITIIAIAKIKLRRLQKKGLVTTVIAGSYAKTSTKHIISHLLKKQIKLIITPKSVNTPLGISQIILKKLTNKHELFVVELGEYYPGDIKKLTNFIEPNWGILTPVGMQHLERMGSIESIVETMAELLDYFKNRKDQVIIAEENYKYYGNNWEYYGATIRSKYRITKTDLSQRGTDFSIHTPQQKLEAFSPLYGVHQAKNLLPSLWLSNKLKLNVEKAAKTASTLPFISRRHEPTFGENNVLILDNSYNTNPDSMKVSLDLINQLKASQRFIVTLGFLELGKRSAEEHLKLGQLLAKKVDYVGLIKSRWNDQVRIGFLKAGGDKSHFMIATTPEEALDLLHGKIKSNSIVLMEGGYQEIFT
jgi:UDP-N-acetylmuramoyl-tripeptide--D-alanyl-D-alanine ligase